MCSCSTVQTGFIDRRFTATHSNRAAGKGLACGRGQDAGPRSLLGREAPRGNGDHLALNPGSSRLADAHAASLWLANSYFPLTPFPNLTANSPLRRAEKLGAARGRGYKCLAAAHSLPCVSPPSWESSPGFRARFSTKWWGKTSLPGLAPRSRHSGAAADLPDMQPPLESYTDLGILVFGE